jgi:hypothetical protein
MKKNPANHQTTKRSMTCEREDIWNMDVNIIGEGVVLGPPVAMRYLIAAIVTMRQKIASTLIRSTDTTFPAIKSNR